MALSLPPWGWWPLALVGIMLFESSLRGEPDRGTRFRRGWLFGAAWLFPGMVWMWFLTPPGYIVAAALFATLHGAAAMIVPAGSWAVIARPLAHTLVEALRFSFPFGGAPLASLAISQSSGPLVGVVRIGGAVLLTWITLQVATVLGGRSPGLLGLSGNRGAEASIGPPHATFALLAVVVWLFVAAFAPAGDGTGRSVRVALVQGGGPQGTRAADVVRCDEDGTIDAAGPLNGSQCVLARHLAATRTLDASDDIDIVVWPENVIDVEVFTTSVAFSEVAAEAERLGAAFLVGVTEETADDRFTNSQVVVTADGVYADRYDKVRRVPFGEYMPLRGLLKALGAPTDLVPRDAVAGTGPAVLDIPGLDDRPGDTRVAIAISWEVFFGGRVRDGVGRGGQLVINPTNGSSYTWTVLQTQQVASLRLRAIETGRWLAEVAPTGFSAFVSPDGDVIDRTSVSEREIVVRDVELRTGDTWYVSLGDKPFVALAALLLAFALWRTRTTATGARASP